MPAHSNTLKNIHVTTQMQNIYGFLFTDVLRNRGGHLVFPVFKAHI